MKTQLARFLLLFLGFLLFPLAQRGQAQSDAPSEVTRAKRLMETMKLPDRSRATDAANILEQYLERSPGNAEALTYHAAAKMYSSGDPLVGQESYKKAIDQGGGASFLVRHSHSTNMPFVGTPVRTTVCTGWLDIRGDGVRFTSDEQEHSFNVPFSDIKEFQRNFGAKQLFHISFQKQNYNFYGRLNSDEEILVIKVLFDKMKAKHSGVKKQSRRVVPNRDLMEVLRENT